jgi:DMSO/TMAO reductase YedYZ molybdopterin-dependent catalytic subunit
MTHFQQFLDEHRRLTRRYFVRLGAAGIAAAGALPLVGRAAERAPKLAKAIEALEPFFTPPAQFRDVSRGKPLPHSLSDEKKTEVGLTRDTWKLEIVSDSENPAKLGKQLTKADGTALDFAGLMSLAEKHAVRFAKVMTCLNIGCPLGMGIWEGVPLRDLIALAQPREDVRRVFYYGYHNDDAGWRIIMTCRRSSRATSSTASGSTARAVGRCGSSSPRRMASSRSSGSRTWC